MTSVKDLQKLVDQVAREKPNQVWVPGLDGFGRKQRKLADYAYPALEALGYVSHWTRFPTAGHVLFRQQDERDDQWHVICDLAVVQEVDGVLTSMSAPFVCYVIGDESKPNFVLEAIDLHDQTLLKPGNPIATSSSLNIDPMGGTGLLVFLSHPEWGMNPNLKYFYTTSDTWAVGNTAQPPGKENEIGSPREKSHIQHVSTFIAKALTTPDHVSHDFYEVVKLIAATHDRLPGLR